MCGRRRRAELWEIRAGLWGHLPEIHIGSKARAVTNPVGRQRIRYSWTDQASYFTGFSIPVGGGGGESGMAAANPVELEA